MLSPETPAVRSTPIEEAETILSRLAWHRRNLEHHRALAGQREEEIRQRIAWNEGQLKEVAIQLRREYGKAETPLPGGGSVRVTKARGRFVILDQMAAERYAETVGALRPRPPVPDLTALRKAIREAGDALYDPSTGELLGWAKVERPADGLSLSYTFPRDRNQPVPDVDMVPVLKAAIADVTGEDED